jgi:hypothetical protein
MVEEVLAVEEGGGVRAAPNPVFDEVEKGKSTTVVLQDWKLDSLDDSMFTKAWLESKSR